MRIGVDACCWSNKRGYGRFTRDLLRALLELDQENQYVFFVDSYTGAVNDFPGNAEVIVVQTSQPQTVAASATGNRSIKDVWKMRCRVVRERPDVFFFPSVYTFFPLFKRIRTIVTIHDAIPELFPELVFSNKRTKLFWKTKQYLAKKQADMILTVSDYSRQAIARNFNIPASNIEVVLEAADVVFRPVEDYDKINEVLRRFGIGEDRRFILYVGGFSPHKNLISLLDVFAELVEETALSGILLVMAGDFTGDSFLTNYPALNKKIDETGLKEKVIFTGFANDTDLACLYNAAEVFVLPSFTEGFGLPAIESVACGTPVVATDASPLPELLGEAGIFFNPHKPEELRDALRRILQDDVLREGMGKCGLTRSKQFSWGRSAAKMIEIFSGLRY